MRATLPAQLNSCSASECYQELLWILTQEWLISSVYGGIHINITISFDWLSPADCFQFLHELPDCVCLHVSLLVVYGIRRAPSLIVTSACHHLPQAARFSIQTTVVCDWCVISSQTGPTAGAGGFLSATFKFLNFALGLITFPFRRACCSQGSYRLWNSGKTMEF